MELNNHHANKGIINSFDDKKSIPTILNNGKRIAASGTDLIRFEEKKERYIWAHPDEIIFVQSADHYVKSLIDCGRQKKWMHRHCTIKELLTNLSSNNFIRLNKFYLLNRYYFSHINTREKMLFIDSETYIHIPHRISPYILGLLKNNYT